MNDLEFVLLTIGDLELSRRRLLQENANLKEALDNIKTSDSFLSERLEEVDPSD